jgi:hypothetical protein
MSNIFAIICLSPTNVFVFFFSNIKSTLEVPRILFQGVNTTFNILRTVKINHVIYRTLTSDGRKFSGNTFQDWTYCRTDGTIYGTTWLNRSQVELSWVNITKVKVYLSHGWAKVVESSITGISEIENISECTATSNTSNHT